MDVQYCPFCGSGYLRFDVEGNAVCRECGCRFVVEIRGKA